MTTDGVRDFRPRIHFTPAKGWMNDPNGLFWDGCDYHLYYQHNPHDAVWGPMYWGAATSRDLLRWRRETTRSSSPRAT